MPKETFRARLGLAADGKTPPATEPPGRALAEAFAAALPPGLKVPTALPGAPAPLDLPPVTVAPSELGNRAYYGNPREGLTPDLPRLPAFAPKVTIKDYDTSTPAGLRAMQADETAGVPGPVAKPMPPETPVDLALNLATLQAGKGEKTPKAMAQADVYAIDRNAARERGMSLKAWREATGPRTGPLARAGKDVAAGALATWQGMTGYLARLAGGDPRLRSLQADMGAKVADLMPADPNFFDDLAAGFGSTAAFFVPGVGIVRGAQAFAQTAPRMALWLGAGAAGGMEAAAEAGGVYERLLAEGKSPEEAAAMADRVFWANTALVTLTDRYGLFAEKGGQVLRRALGAVNEGMLQEGPQQIVSNLATGRPWYEGVPRSVAIGGIVGGGLAGSVRSPQARLGAALDQAVDERQLPDAEAMARQALMPERAAAVTAGRPGVAGQARSPGVEPGGASRETPLPATAPAAPLFSRESPPNGYTAVHGRDETQQDRDPAAAPGRLGTGAPGSVLPNAAGRAGHAGDGRGGHDSAAAQNDDGRGVPAAEGEIQVDDLDAQAFVAGLTPQELQNPNIVAYARQEWRARGWDSPFFRKWFGDGYFRQPDGEPQIMYHGTPAVFEAFDKAKIGASGHAASGLGFFLTTNRDQADHYRDGGQVMELVTNIRNPYRMSLAEFAGFESVEQARARAAELQAQGYDGIYVETPKVPGERPQTYVIAFEPTQIKSVDNRDTFDAAADNIYLSRQRPPGRQTAAAQQQSPAQAGLSVSAVEKIIAGVILKWGGNAPRVQVVASMADLPAHVQAQADAQEGIGTVQGVHDPETNAIYLVASGLRDRTAVLRTLAHEAVGHYGLEAILGRRLDSVLERVQWLRKQGDPVIVRLAAAVDAAYGELSPHTQAREIIARLAEEGVRHPLLVRLLDALRAFLRKLGFSIRFSVADLRAMLVKAARHLESDRPSAAQRTRIDERMFSRGTRFSEVPVPPRTARWMGFEGPIRLFADFAALQRRHAEYYRSADEVRKDVEYVLASPDDWFPHADGRITIFRQGAGGVPSLRIDFRFERKGMGGYRIVSVYPMTRRSIAGKMKKKSGDLGRDGRISERIVSSMKPGYLSIAEYLGEAQGNGSSAPASPSGEAHQAPAENIAADPAGRNGEGVSRETAEANRRDVQVPVKDSSVPEKNKARETGKGGNGPSFSRAEPEMLDALETAAQETLRDRAGVALDRLKAESYGLLTRQMLADVGKGVLPQIGTYVKIASQMDADRNALLNEAGELANRWVAFLSQDREAANRLAGLMHEATVAGVDPSEDYAPVIDIAEGRRKVAILKQKARGRGGEGTAKFLQEIEETLATMRFEEGRREAWPALRRRYEALPAEAKALFAAVRDMYRQRFEATQQALQERIDRAELSASEQRALKAKLRQHFEKVTVQGPYFPLARFGEFWVSAKKGEGEGAETRFYMFEGSDQQRRQAAALRRAGYKVTVGKKLENAPALQGASAGFVADVVDIIEKTGGSGTIAEKVKDEIYQLYLSTLPDLSLRKRFIHRKKTKGYSQDALRAFARDMFHGAHQLARLRHADKLETLLENMRESVPASSDPNKAADIFNELQKRHQWLMNPQSHWLAQFLTSAGFVFYLGLTPAAALVNTLQTPLVAFPVLGAEFGMGKAFRALEKAGRDYFAGGMDIEAALSDEERRAYQVLVDAGVIEKTLAHDLAGLSETPSSIYSTRAAKAMQVVTFLFHRAEVFNRQVTAMAAYRLARASGLGVEAAVDKARELTLESHFEYSNANRARFMQSNGAKVLLLFKQYSLNMAWLLGRNLQLATAPARAGARNALARATGIEALRKQVDVDVETARLARRKLAGILFMTALAGGMNAMPLLWLVELVLEALFDDEDDPWSFETEVRNFLYDHLGARAADAVYRGPVEALTGVGISDRISLNELFFRSPDRDLEGKAAADYWLEQLAGPVAAIGVNTWRGTQLVREGHLYRGIEAMMPKVAKDAMKAWRYASEGLQNLRGDVLIGELSPYEIGLQASGFTPGRVAKRYDANRAFYNYDDRIAKRRARLVNRWAMAMMTGDGDGIREALAAIQRFNGKNPSFRIGQEHLKGSLKRRLQYSTRNRGGVYVTKRNLGTLNRIRFANE